MKLGLGMRVIISLQIAPINLSLIINATKITSGNIVYT